MSSFFRARTIRSSTIPISDGIGSLAAILRRVDVDPERSFAEWRVNNLDDGIGDGIGVWLTGGNELADFISEARS